MRVRLFWTAVGLVTYTYLLFPIILLLRAVLAPRPHVARPITPSVSLVIAARNEEGAIAGKLNSIDRLEYPTELLEIIVASDGSTDRTEEIVAAHRGRRVRLLRIPRQGKAAALNTAVQVASGEILVFSDANSRFAPDAIGRLVEHFADPVVGGVAGNQVYDLDPTRRARNDGERTYWSLDRLLKRAESRAGHVISATGAIYAIRRELFDEIPDGVTDDFYTSVGVIARGRRLVFAPDAIAFEPPASSTRLEFNRKVRIMTRGLASVLSRAELLDPRRHGFYAIQLASRKLLRRLMATPLALCAVLAPALWRRGAVYRLATVVQVAFYACAVIGLLPWRMAQLNLFSLPAFVCSALAASALATWNLVRGHRIDRWEPVHGDEREAQ